MDQILPSGNLDCGYFLDSSRSAVVVATCDMRVVSARGRRLAIRSHSEYADEVEEGDYEYSGCGLSASDMDLTSRIASA